MKTTFLTAQWVSAENQPVFPGFIQVKKAVDASEWRDVDDPYLELEKSTNKRCVVVIRNGGKPLLFTSGVDCAKAMGIKTTLLDYRLKSNGEKSSVPVTDIAITVYLNRWSACLVMDM